LARHHGVMLTIEEGSAGGFSAHVLGYLASSGLLDSGLKVRPLYFPDLFIEQNSMDVQYAEAGLDADHIFVTALEALGRPQSR